MVEEMLTMLPAPCCCITRSSCFTLSSVPSTLVSNIVLMAHVGGDERGLGAKAAQFGLKRLAFGLAAAGYDDGGAFASKGQSGGAADACESAGDEDDGSGHGNCPLAWARRARTLPVGYAGEVRCRCWTPICGRLALLKKTL